MKNSISASVRNEIIERRSNDLSSTTEKSLSDNTKINYVILSISAIALSVYVITVTLF